MFRVLIAAAALLLWSETAAAQEVGDSRTVIAYCTTLEDATALTQAAIQDGNEGYRRVMADQSSKCFSAQFHRSIQPITVTLVEKAWTMTHKNGSVFDFWVANDSRGNPGWIWILVSEPPEPAQET